MKFGHFDDSNKEYVITNPKTPWPWINYLGSKKFFSLISNTAGGYSFHTDARLRRLTRYRYNNVPLDFGGRYMYINDNGDCWTPGFMPMRKELSKYECRHGLGYTSITGERNDIEINQLIFVPVNDNCEIQRVTVKNVSGENKKIRLFSFLEFCLWDAQDDATNFQRNFSTGEVEIGDSVIYHKTEYRERRNHFSFFSVNTEVAGFDSDRESFIGLYNGYDSPQAVIEGKSRNSIASGWSPIGSHSIDVELNSGEEKTFVFILGYIENPKEEKWEKQGIINKKRALKMMDDFGTTEKVDAALTELNAFWEDLVSKYVLASNDDKLNRMVNIWNTYQCMVTFNMSRSASYFESGIGRGMGFRDSNQDLLGFVHQVPERARERIIDIASTQFENGGAYHQYQPLTKKGNNDIGSGFNDDPLWLICGVSAYIKESGDYSILDEMVPFDNDENNKATLLEHLKRSFYFTVNNKGPHGLPLIGRADWNDCCNLNCYSDTPGESFQITENKGDGKTAESIFIAGMFCQIGPEFVELCKYKGMDDEAAAAQKEIDIIYKTVLEHGWDGEWFLRAYDANSNKVGSKECEDGKIFIEPQGYCVMGGIGVKEGLAEKALNSVKKYLETDHGIIINYPSYKDYHLEYGEMSSYPPGYKENGGIFCHNNPWVMIAETVIGRGDRAFELYKKIAPAYREEISDLHRTEPYVYSQMIAGKDAVRHGEAKNSWLTGTAAWNYVAITQYILGVRPDYNGLIVDPCIPKDWDTYKVTRIFRGATYNIIVKNSGKVSKGVKKVIVNGNTINGNIIPIMGKGSVNDIEVVLG